MHLVTILKLDVEDAQIPSFLDVTKREGKKDHLLLYIERVVRSRANNMYVGLRD